MNIYKQCFLIVLILCMPVLSYGKYESCTNSSSNSCNHSCFCCTSREESAKWMETIGALMVTSGKYYQEQNKKDPYLVCKECKKVFSYNDFCSNLFGMALKKVGEGANALATIKVVIDKFEKLLLLKNHADTASFMLEYMRDCDVIWENSSACSHCHGEWINPYVIEVDANTLSS